MNQRRRRQTTQLTAKTPFRPPAWRWQRACEIVDRGDYATNRFDGTTICRAVQFIRKSKRLGSERGVRNLAKREPDIYLALNQEGTLRSTEIAARVLARQKDEAIAWRVGLPVRAVTTYVELFFDVRSRLDARSWIAHSVAGLDPHRPPSPISLMLMSAYRRGPNVVEPWIDFLQHQDEPHDLKTKIGRERAAIQLLVDIQHLEDTPDMLASLEKCLDSAVVIGSKMTKSASIAGALSKNLHRMKGVLQFQCPDLARISGQANEAFARQPSIDHLKRQHAQAG